MEQFPTDRFPNIYWILLWRGPRHLRSKKKKKCQERNRYKFKSRVLKDTNYDNQKHVPSICFVLKNPKELKSQQTERNIR